MLQGKGSLGGRIVHLLRSPIGRPARCVVSFAVLLALALPLPAVQAAPLEQVCPPTSGLAAAPGFVAVATAASLGCERSEPFPTAVAVQAFEHGTMIWVQEWGSIQVLLEDGSYAAYDDLYSPDKPASMGLVAPAGRIEPVAGFGLAWQKAGGPGSTVGWATAPEESFIGTLQYFDSGAVLQAGAGTPYAFAVVNHTRGQWSRAP